MAWRIFGRRAERPVSHDTAPPDTVLAGRYRLGRHLGDGAHARVYEAVDTRTGAPVVVKLAAVPDDLSLVQRADWLARMQREVNVARRVAHPGVLALLDAGIGPQGAWLVTERVQGHDLSRYTAPSRLLPEPVVLKIGAQIAQTLAHVHELGVVHRDLKPSNVLVDLAGGVVKLADFGVARFDDAHVTRTGMTLGTPAYMAPEQLAGASASPEADTWALGVMLFELLGGRRPHGGDTLGQLLHALASEPPASLAALRPDLPVAVVDLVERLLARMPQDRPADLRAWAEQAANLAAVIERVLNDLRRARA